MTSNSSGTSAQDRDSTLRSPGTRLTAALRGAVIMVSISSGATPGKRVRTAYHVWNLALSKIIPTPGEDT